MKSNEEFIAGIYEKAERIKAAEQEGNLIAADFTRKEKKSWTKSLYRGAPVLVAAAALLLVIGRSDVLKTGNPSTSESGVMMASEEMSVEQMAIEVAPDIAMAEPGDAAMMRRTMSYQLTGQVVRAEAGLEVAEISYEIEEVTVELKKYVLGSEELLLEETEKGGILTVNLSLADFEKIPGEVLVSGMSHDLVLSDGEEGWYLSGLGYVLGEIASMMLLGK